MTDVQWSAPGAATLSLYDSPCAAPPTSAPVTAGGSYAGPERRRAGSLVSRWLTASLDEVDYPMLLVGEGARVLHANRTARAELDDSHPLQIVGSQLRVRAEADAGPLRDGLESATRRGLRRLMTVGAQDGRPASVAVVPLALTDAEGQHAALLMFGKRRVCPLLSVQWFARSHGLTRIETQVLEALCEGANAREIAKRHGVMLSTVRTQIGSVRAKTGAASLRDLLNRVSALPPLLGLQCAGRQPQWRRAGDSAPAFD